MNNLKGRLVFCCSMVWMCCVSLYFQRWLFHWISRYAVKSTL